MPRADLHALSPQRRLRLALLAVVAGEPPASALAEAGITLGYFTRAFNAGQPT